MASMPKVTPSLARDAHTHTDTDSDSDTDAITKSIAITVKSDRAVQCPNLPG